MPQRGFEHRRKNGRRWLIRVAEQGGVAAVPGQSVSDHGENDRFGQEVSQVHIRNRGRLANGKTAQREGATPQRRDRFAGPAGSEKGVPEFLERLGESLGQGFRQLHEIAVDAGVQFHDRRLAAQAA